MANSDFTNSFQSQRLLELGVPEWTANCFMLTNSKDNMVYSVPAPYNFTQWRQYGAEKCGDVIIPIWSSGRLEDILQKTLSKGTLYRWRLQLCNATILNRVGMLYESIVTFKEGGLIDFTKLYEGAI